MSEEASEVAETGYTRTWGDRTPCHCKGGPSHPDPVNPYCPRHGESGESGWADV